MIINHNMSALNATRTYGVNNENVAGNMAKLASGLRINKAGDDASGLAVSGKMRKNFVLSAGPTVKPNSQRTRVASDSSSGRANRTAPA